VALEQRRKEGGRKTRAASTPPEALHPACTRASTAAQPNLSPYPVELADSAASARSSVAAPGAAQGSLGLGLGRGTEQEQAQAQAQAQQLAQARENELQLREQLEAHSSEISSMQRRLKAAQHRLTNYAHELADAESCTRALRQRAEEADTAAQQHAYLEHDLCEKVSQLELELELERERSVRMSNDDHSLLWRRTVHDWVGLGLGYRTGGSTDAGCDLPNTGAMGSNTRLADWETNLEGALLKIRSAKAEIASLYKQSHPGGDDNSNSNSLCCVCREVPKSILLLPCRHLCVCEDCGDRCYGHGADPDRRQQRCPVCRTHVVDRLRVFS